MYSWFAKENITFITIQCLNYKDERAQLVHQLDMQGKRQHLKLLREQITEWLAG